MSDRPKSDRQNKVNNSLVRIVSDFINQNSSRNSLITVMRCDVAPDLSKATAYISVMPDDKEGPALSFLKRRERDLFEYAKNRSELRRTPRISFALDIGEKNRQKINELSLLIKQEDEE